MRVALTAGHRGSLHTILLIAELAERGHDVVLVLEVSLLDPGRARAYLRQWGLRRMAGKLASRFGGGRAGGPAAGEVAPLRARVAAARLPATVRQTAEVVGARHLAVRDLNGDEAVRALTDSGADVLVYAGGGILRGSLLDVPERGTLNAHGGPLPAYRGMNASEWALFDGVEPAVTVHLVDRGVDTGPVLFERPVAVRPDDSIYDIRGRAALIGVEALLDAVDAVATGSVTPVPQDLEAGRQHFVMAPPLLEVLERWRAEGRTPIGRRSS